MSISNTDIRDAAREARRRQRPEFKSIDKAEAEAQGYRAVTSAYSTRLFSQCEMLQKIIDDMKGVDITLVHTSKDHRMIEVWRKR